MASCYSCASQFSLFQKQKVCESCKLSFCKNCLKQSLKIDGVVKSVCERCHKQVGEKRDVYDSEPPALFLKRLEEQNNLSRPIAANQTMKSLKRGLSEKDLEIANRLERLMEDVHKPKVLTEEETRRRLNVLQDVEPSTSTKQPVYQAPLTAATESEQVDMLLKKYVEEMAIGGRGANIEEESDDDNSAVAKVMEQAMAEAALPHIGARSGGITPPDWEPEDVSNDLTELPWCEICNNDAMVRCVSCDNALYCQRCLRETHDSFDLKDHRTIPFRNQ